jgi:hypothetical protein
MLEPAYHRVTRKTAAGERQVSGRRTVQRTEAKDTVGPEPLRVAACPPDQLLELRPGRLSLASETI